MNPVRVLMVEDDPGLQKFLASCLKKSGAKTYGERTPGFGVERARFALRQGGAVELVSKRWVGLGGEKLDRQGVVPGQVLRLTDTDDPLARVLTALAAPAPADKPTAPAADEILIPDAGAPPHPPKKPNP